MSIDWATSIRTAGYEVAVGTFGTPLSVQTSPELAVLPKNHQLPDFAEQEIVLADFAGPAPEEGQPSSGARGITEWMQTCEEGYIDPRPLVMNTYAKDARRLVDHGGWLIVTASSKWPTHYSYGDGFNISDKVTLSPWSLLSKLAYFDVENQSGSEIEFESTAFAQLLKRGAGKATYSCVMNLSGTDKDRWLPLAKNKYGRDVAGMLLIGDKPARGVLMLPRMPQLHLIARELLEDWIANWNPKLFPHIEGQAWVHRPEYELPAVTRLLTQMDGVKKEAERRTSELTDELEQERTKNKYWYSLLRGTDDELVAAVIDAFRKIGFARVVDVDAEAKQVGNAKLLREDIQIHDRTPTLVIDVKGVRGHPDDDESRQSEKHATMRMREWKRTDVQPLTIINSQRHLPPEDRDSVAYRAEIIANAKDTELGLMTTWDLFNILRNMTLNQWPTSATQDIFYQTGRIDPVPSHYKELGKIVKRWEHSFGIIPTTPISVGDTIAVQVGVGFAQFEVVSLKIDGKPVQEAGANQNVGVGCDDPDRLVRENYRVFKVAPPSDASRYHSMLAQGMRAASPATPPAEEGVRARPHGGI